MQQSSAGSSTAQNRADHWFSITFLSFFAFLICFIFDGWTGFSTLALIFNLSSLALTWARFLGSRSLILRPVSYGLLVLALIVSGFPCDSSNPFSFFQDNVFQYLFTLIPAFLAALFVDQNRQQDKVDRFNFWIPIAFLVGLHLFFVLLDYRDLLPFDSSRHLLNALSIYSSLQGDSGLKLWEVFMYYDFYQPVAYIAASPFFWVFGKSVTSANLCQVLFWLPLAYWGVYKTLRYLRFGSGIASMVGFMVLSGALSYSLLRHFMQDFPVLVMVVWFQYHLLKSGFLKHSSGAWKAGLFFGLGILTKASFLFFSIGLVALFLVLLLRKGFFKQAISRIENLLFFILPVVLTAGFWFMVNRSHYGYTLPSMRNFAALNNLANAEELSSWFWYWKRLDMISGYPLVALVLAGGVLSFLKNTRIRWVEGFGLLSFFLIIALVSSIPNKDARTVFPLVGFLIIPLACTFRYLEGRVSFSLASFYTFWLMVGGFTLTYDWDWKFLSSLKPTPFVVLSKPLDPSAETPNLSYFSYRKLMKANYSDSLVPPLQFGENDNYHSRQAFQLLLPDPQTKNLKNRGQERIIFARNKFWPDHYLWSLSYRDSMMVLEELGQYNQIDGDYLIELYWLDEGENTLKVETVNLLPGPGNWKFSVPPGSTKVRYGLKIHHTHPKGQWVQLVYDLLGKKDYNGFNIPLLLFNSDTKPVETLVYKFR